MWRQYKLLILMLALMPFLMLVTSSQASASNADTIAAACLGPAGQQYNQNIQTNSEAFQQQLLTHGQNISFMYPITSALSTCVQQMANIMKELPSIANPFAAGNFLFTAIIGQIALATCSSVMDTVSSVQNAITGITKICLPLPSFNPFETPTINGPTCSGSIQINTLTGFQTPLTTSTTYGYSQYQSQ